MKQHLRLENGCWFVYRDRSLLRSPVLAFGAGHTIRSISTSIARRVHEHIDRKYHGYLDARTYGPYGATFAALRSAARKYGLTERAIARLPKPTS